MAKNYDYKTPKRRQPIFRIFRAIIKPFFSAKVINNAGDLPDKCIILSNHSAKRGPMVMETSFPVFCGKWGAYPMLGTYKERFRYLRDVLCIQKLKRSKFSATISSLILAFFSKWIYKGMKIIPSFSDARLRKTIQYSIETLESGAGVMIFPEDSSDGYFDVLTSLFPGFVMLSQAYYKKHGDDLPVYIAYYHRKSSEIRIEKPVYVQKLLSQGMTKEQIAEHCKDRINAIYYDNYAK